jgi:Mn2+/Fe2+ NRAMP family transporter
LITGASGNDPSGIGAYAMARGQLGDAPLWTALLTGPLMESVQFICAQIASVTVQDFARVLLAMLHSSTCNRSLTLSSGRKLKSDFTEASNPLRVLFIKEN